MALSQRFWAKVDKHGSNGCWLWTGCKVDGYGMFSVGGKGRGAHRLSWEALRGPIPPGLHIDHLCRVPACVKPDHLEPVTPRENTMRGQTKAAELARRTACLRRQHPYTPENTKIDSRGHRICRACDLERQRSWKVRTRYVGPRHTPEYQRAYRARRKAAASGHV